jgi:hypothetical protein
MPRCMRRTACSRSRPVHGASPVKSIRRSRRCLSDHPRAVPQGQPLDLRRQAPAGDEIFRLKKNQSISMAGKAMRGRRHAHPCSMCCPRVKSVRSCAARRSGIGRVEVWRGGCRSNISVCRPFRLAVPQWFDHGSVSTPRSSNRTCRFPASGSRTRPHAFFRVQRHLQFLDTLWS